MCTTTQQTQPAQYGTFKATKSTSTYTQTCGQFLVATVEQQSQPANISGYTCPSGTTLDGTNCLSTTTLEGTPNYACPSGWSLSGSTCSQTLSQSASIASYSCAAGFTLSDSTCSQTRTRGLLVFSAISDGTQS